MNEFDKTIGRVWRRLRGQRFLSALVWCWTATLLVTAVVIGIERLANWPLPGPDWVPFAVAGGVGFVIATLIAAFSGPSRLDAAVAIDHAFHLNERLSTALTLPADVRATPAGQALLHDTVRHVEGLDLGSQFGLRIPRKAWIPLVPGLVAVALLFVPAWIQQQAQAGNRQAQATTQKDVAKEAKVLNKRLSEMRKEIDKNKFAETEKLLAEIEKATEDLVKSPPADREKALLEMNKLTDALKERQKQLGNADQISKKLQELKQMASDGPADEFAKNLARGDFQQAAEDLKQLMDKLTSDKMSEQEKKQLEEQVGEMRKQLERLANMEERRNQLDEALKRGTINQEQFDREMAKLNEQSKDLQKMQQMAEKLAAAEKAMGQGDMKQTAEALGMTQEQLESMAEELAEMEMLDAAMAELQDAKNGMTGEGLNQLGNRLSDLGMMGMGDGMGNNGMGLGRGRGQGDRPEAPDDTAAYDSKVRQQMTKGKAIFQGFGPPSTQMIGESQIDAQGITEGNPGVAADALSNQKVPKRIEKHVLNYFEEFQRQNP